MRERQC